MATDKLEPRLASSPGLEPVSEVSVPWGRVESFVGQLAHDVRNGLNACELQLTFLGEVCQDPEAADEVKRLRTSLLAITKHLQAVRIATAAVMIYPLEYPAPEFLEDLQERFGKLHPDDVHRITWSSELHPAFTLLTDPALSLQVCLELLDNALKFDKAPGSTVRFSARNGEETASFTLLENPAVAPTIPTEHWGYEPLLSTRRGSYGLGLFRVRRILEGQGGKLEITYDAAANELVSVLSLPGRAQK